MPGRKKFINQLEIPLEVTLYVRKGQKPEERAGIVEFNLGPYETRFIDYGNYDDINLNGFKISGEYQGAKIEAEKRVNLQHGPFDNELNRNDTIEFHIANNFFYITTRNTWTS